ncbi:DUF1272 domain-containing protein [Streptomyces sp. NBC_00893]|nr:DUF1272 domain-containing protein [Streptomyces sp. NBC_00893]
MPEDARTLCAPCGDLMQNACPNCGGELVARPRRGPAPAALQAADGRFPPRPRTFPRAFASSPGRGVPAVVSRTMVRGPALSGQRGPRPPTEAC